MVSKIEKAKYNRWYKWIREEEVPEYLKKERKEDKWRMVARFRLGNEMKEGLYWREEEERRCKRCGTEEKTWGHVLERCRENREQDIGWQDAVRKILAGDGKGIE